MGNKNYIRTDKGYIFHNLSCKQISGLKLLSHQYGSIAKHSKNIIDLIEIGDIVRALVNTKTQETMIYTVDCKADLSLLNNQNIKSIVTHEQFENIEYRLEDN